MGLKFIFILVFLSFLFGCVANHASKAQSLRFDAYEVAQKGQYENAIIKAKVGLKYAQLSRQINVELIEAYDDLGLYHFKSGDFENAVYYQSVATVLSFYRFPSDQKSQIYLQRLGWAYSKYIPGFKFSEVSKSPLVLVCNRENTALRNNEDIRRFLFKSRSNVFSKYKYRRYKLKGNVC